MHPVLGHGSRLLLYLLVWLPVGILLAAMLRQGGAGWGVALALALPMALFCSFLCLGSWYPSRALPLGRAQLWRMAGTHGLGALLSSSLWLGFGWLWSSVLDRSSFFDQAQGLLRQQVLPVFAFGLLFYLLAAGASYLFLAVESSHAAERRALEAQQKEQLTARELELGRQLQARLLPPTSLREEAFRLTACNVPANVVAGDFYDYFRLPDGSWRFAVADVAGKGMAAGLITATVKAMLPLIAGERSVVETMGELNQRLKEQLGPREFVALLLASYDPSSRRLEVANAGLPDPYHLRSSGALEVIEVPQPRLPLGLREKLEYQRVEMRLDPGDRVLFLTDGLPEAPDPSGEPLGYEALAELLEEQLTDSENWLETVLERIRVQVAEDQQDDWTVLLLRADP